ncbi:LLM class F420-dependent oxidoreductase [Spirillospora sp. NPDC048911]|uniref:LLM class F420-dependent oxidoreductase n=1 Tax=Spirillospora sp. NPDC048911 TaxID=3364527 RepID=UPI003718274C
MKFGITMFPTDLTATVSDAAKEAEDRGFSSLFLAEHTHVPVDRSTPFPGTPDGSLPQEYHRLLDPFVALAAAAAVTSRIRLGTAVSLVAQREPIVTAKAAATLDLISGGRFDFGVGFGWMTEETRNHGVDPGLRRAVVREHVLAMRALWTQDEAAFTGEHVSFEPSFCWPKPVQPGGPPILLGGFGGPVLCEHIAEYADGWLPVGSWSLAAGLPNLRKAMAERDRDLSDLRIVPCGGFPPNPQEVEYFASAGVEEIVLTVPDGPPERLPAVLDHYAATYLSTT